MNSFFRRCLLPGLLFQSVIISGGYSTGRELVEFFMTAGPIGGFVGIVGTMLIMSCILGCTFEFARVHSAYDYRRFFKLLLGNAWVVFEVAFVAVAVLALAVIGAAAGAIFADMSNSSEAMGTIVMMTVIGVLAFYGTSLIERIISIWSFVLYAAYLALFVAAFNALGPGIASAIGAHPEVTPDWVSTLEYSGINLAAAPAVLFGLAHLETRRDSVIAGALAGPLAMIPALLFYVVLLSQYPGVLNAAVPLVLLLDALQVSVFALLFKIVIFGTYIETGTALVHSINERLAGLRKEQSRQFPKQNRVAIAATTLVLSIYLAHTVGLIDLIGKGYGTLTYIILAVYVLPLLTIGLVKIRSSQGDASRKVKR